MLAVRNYLKDYQQPKTSSAFGVNGHLTCHLCRATVPPDQHMGYGQLYCLRCKAEQDARILGHQKRVAREMKACGILPGT